MTRACRLARVSVTQNPKALRLQPRATISDGSRQRRHAPRSRQVPTRCLSNAVTELKYSPQVRQRQREPVSRRAITAHAPGTPRQPVGHPAQSSTDCNEHCRTAPAASLACGQSARPSHPRSQRWSSGNGRHGARHQSESAMRRSLATGESAAASVPPLALHFRPYCLVIDLRCARCPPCALPSADSWLRPFRRACCDPAIYGPAIPGHSPFPNGNRRGEFPNSQPSIEFAS